MKGMRINSNERNENQTKAKGMTINKVKGNENQFK
jgi:hypothetical protein